MSEYNDENECPVHNTISDPECDWCNRDIETLNDLYMKQVAKNQRMEKDLAREGAQMNPFQFLNMRMDIILQIVTGGDPKRRLKIEMAFSQQVEHGLMTAQQEAIRAKLTGGGKMPPGNVRVQG